MGLVIHKEKISRETGEKLKGLCPFGAINYSEKDGLSIGMGCRLCKLCVKKSDGAVTLVGRTSGGGSCVVQSMATAWGTIYQMSGFKRLSYIKNGSFYDVDRGAQPDVVISTPEKYYDRAALTDFINSIY